MLIQVNPHKIVLIKTNDVNSGEYNVNECTFEFSQEFDNLTCIAVFSLCDGTTKNITILNNRCIIPTEVLTQTGQVKIGVYGYSVQDDELVLRYSPAPQIFVVTEGSYKEGTEPVAPTPTDWEILVEQVSDNSRDISNIKEDITGINGEISGINIDIRDLQDTKANINDLSAVAFSGSYNDLINKPNLSVYATKTDLSDEATLRENADVSLQEQIDAISVSSDVVDVVGTYQELLNYDTQHLKDNDIVKVLVDSTHNDALSYYRWDKEPQTWSYIGSEGPFYTKAETRELLNAKEDKITTTNKLDADLVDDSNSTNKFVTEEDITYWDNKEDKSNKVTEINSSSTDTEYPSAKCVYDSQEEQNEQIAELEMLYNAFPTVSAENETIQLDNTAKVKFREIDLKGNTSQVVIPEEQGTSVSNTSIYVSDVDTDKEHTIEMSGNTYQETTNGKNLLSPTIVTDANYKKGTTTTYNNETGYYTTTGTTTNSYPWVVDTNVSILTGTTLTISSNSQYRVYARLYYTSSDYEEINSTTSITKTVTHDIIRIGILLNIQANIQVNDTYYVQIETGSTATSFEPFTNGASPNPDYPQNIDVVTGENDITICGKNLNNGIDYKFYIGTTGTTYRVSGNDKGLCIEVNGNSNYTISTTTTQNRYRVACCNSLPTTTEQRCYNGTNKDGTNDNIIINTSGYKYLLVNATDLTAIQIEQGSTATTYEQYQGTTYPVNLGNIELCKIGDYKDRIYYSSGKWYKYSMIGKAVLSQLTWVQETSANSKRYSTTGIQNSVVRPANNSTIINMLCNIYIKNQASWTWNTISGKGIAVQKNGQLIIFDEDYTNSDDLTNFTTMLGNKNAVLYYPLATPITTEITDTTLVNQLNALYNATIYPITNINTDTSNLLPYIDLHYNFVTPSPSPSRPSVVNVVKGNNTITISNSDNTESQVFPINLGDMELCKIGTYQDYIYESNGNWFKKNNVKVATDIIGSTSKTISDMVSNATIYSYCGGTVSGTTITYTSELLVANTIYYPTTTPTDTQITDTTLITQLNNIKKAYSYDTQTNISQTNTDKPFIIYAEAIRSLKDVFE